nr:hypothetical protein [Tanacetum cinerariifolium]
MARKGCALHHWINDVLSSILKFIFVKTDSIEVHPVFPTKNDTMHERPSGKIGLYTTFFNSANFRLPLSTFLVDVLRHFRINISQLSMIKATKSGWTSFSKRFDNAPHVTRDPDPVAAKFNAQDYATLVSHPSSLWKFSEAFMCLVGLSRHYTLDEETYPWFLHKNEEEMDIFAFIHTSDPTKYCSAASFASDRPESELEDSVERLFDEGGSGNQTEQGDSAIVKAANTVVEDMAPVQSKHQGKRKYVVADAGGRLLARAVLNVGVGIAAIPTLPFVTASVSTTSEREDGNHTDSMAEPNLCTIGASQRFVISSDSSHHSGPTIAGAEVDPLVRSSAPIMTTATTVTSTVNSALVAKEKPVKPSLDFLVGGIRTVIDLDTDLQKVYVPQWRVTNRSHLDDSRVYREMVDEFALPKSFISLSAEVRMRTKYHFKKRRTLKSIVEKEVLRDEVNALKGCNVIFEKERNALDVKVTYLEASVVGKERDLTDFNAQLTFVKSKNDNLTYRKITVYDNYMNQLEKFQDDRMKVVNDKLTKIDSDLVEMACHLKERFYPYLLNTISGRRWLLTHVIKLFLVKCLNSFEYLMILGAAISRVEKGMQSGLTANIDHGREGRSLANVASYNLMRKQTLTPPFKSSLKVPILRSKDQVVLGETYLSFALSVLHSHVEQIRENIAAPRSALVGVWTPFSEPLSVSSLMHEASTSGVVPAAFVTITALSTTFASARSIPPISKNDYEIVGVDGQEGVVMDGRVVADGNVAPFPDVVDVEINIPQ